MWIIAASPTADGTVKSRRSQKTCNPPKNNNKKKKNNNNNSNSSSNNNTACAIATRLKIQERQTDSQTPDDCLALSAVEATSIINIANAARIVDDVISRMLSRRNQQVVSLSVSASIHRSRA